MRTSAEETADHIYSTLLCPALGFPPQSEDIQFGLTGNSELSIAVNISVNACLCFCDKLATRPLVTQSVG